MENISADRRKFLSYFTTLVLTVIGFLVAIPALSYFWAPLRKKHHAEDSGDGFLDVGSLAEIPVGEWRLRSLEMAREDGWKKTKVRHSFWVRRQGADGKDIPSCRRFVRIWDVRSTGIRITANSSVLAMADFSTSLASKRAGPRLAPWIRLISRSDKAGSLFGGRISRSVSQRGFR